MLQLGLGVLDKVLGYFVDSPEVKTKKAEVKHELEMAKLEAKRSEGLANLSATTDYDNLAMKNKDKSKMDEIIAFIHLAPIWLPAIDALKNGNFTGAGKSIMMNLVTAPSEWWIVYLGIVSSTFGLRWMIGKQEVNKMVKAIELRKIKNEGIKIKKQGE